MGNLEYFKKPELLAPAGSIESFHAAIDAGADAVYLGLNKYNARLRAKNFSIRTLSYLVPFARMKNIKTYITLNTVIKQNEIKEVIDILFQLEQIGVDAVIIQDLGLASIAHTYFPKIALHASTQMVIHNIPGVKAVEKLGYKRAILSRECSLAEIKSIQESTSIELETFIHGALCYSISGLCLASSYLGGLSGNRGRCTQVCRRRFESQGKSGFYFSSRDLCAVDFIKDFIKIGIRCFKIEGRMKSAEHVYSVVSSYRKVIDNEEFAEQLKTDLLHDLGRKKTTFFLPSFHQKGILDISHAPGTGILLGIIDKVYKDSIEIKTGEKLAIGDKIRINISDRAEGFIAKISGISYTEKHCKISVNNSTLAKPGNLAYLISRKISVQEKWSHNQVTIKPVYYKEQCPFSHKILKKNFNYKNEKSKNNHLFIRIDSSGWLTYLQSTRCDGIIVQCIKEDLQALKTNTKLLKKVSSKIIISLPPFIPQSDISLWRDIITDLRKMGINKWMCGNIGQRELVPSFDMLYADSTLWCTNSATQQALQHMGFHKFSYSPEDDILNLKATGSINGLMTIFAYIPLFISRIDPPLKLNSFITDDKKCGFFIKKQNGLYYLIGEKPLCLTHRIDKFNTAGINSFILDLSFCQTDKSILRSVLSYYYDKKKIPDTTLFNHKAGLK